MQNGLPKSGFKQLTVASKAETRPPNPTSGFDLAASPIDVAAKLKRTMRATLTQSIQVTDSLLRSISHAGVLLTNMPTYFAERGMN